MRPADAGRFYDDLSPFYDLVYENWDESMARQGAAIEAILSAELGSQPSQTRVLDVASGIGTQALPLATRGFHVDARDLSSGAIGRLRREASARGVVIDAGVADMREVASSVSRQYDAVLACDNSVPHLSTDDDILAAFRQFRHVLRPGGLCVCTVRDYSTVPHGVDATHPYGERRRDGETFKLWQEWKWEDPTHYRVTLVVERVSPKPEPLVRTEARYYALSTDRLLELMSEAGFGNCRRSDDLLYQPVLLGRAP